MEKDKIEKLMKDIGVEVRHNEEERNFLEVMEEVVCQYKKLPYEQKLYFKQVLFGLL